SVWARQRGQQGRHLGKSAKPNKNAQAAGMGDKCERRRAALTRRCRLRRGRMRRPAGFTGREKCCLAGKETSLDRADRWKEKGRAARGITWRKPDTALVGGRKAERLSLEPAGRLRRRV